MILLLFLTALLLDSTKTTLSCKVMLDGSEESNVHERRLRCDCSDLGNATWHRYGDKVPVDGDKYRVDNTTGINGDITYYLIIRNITPNDEGIYTCQRGNKTSTGFSLDVPVNQSDRINSYNITVRPNEIITIDSECEIGPETAKKIRKSINFKIKLCAYGPDNRKLKKVNISEWEWPKDVTTGVIPQFNMSYDELFMINQLSYLRWEIFYSTSSPTRKCSKYYITLAPKVTISLLTDSCQLKCTAKHPSVTDDNSINIEWIRNGETIPTNDGIVTIDNAGGRYNCSASFGGITQEETYYTEGCLSSIPSSTSTTEIVDSTSTIIDIPASLTTTEEQMSSTIPTPSTTPSITPTDADRSPSFIEKHPYITALMSICFILIVIIIIMGFCVINIRRNRINSNKNDSGERGDIRVHSPSLQLQEQTQHNDLPPAVALSHDGLTPSPSNSTDPSVPVMTQSPQNQVYCIASHGIPVQPSVSIRPVSATDLPSVLCQTIPQPPNVPITTDNITVQPTTTTTGNKDLSVVPCTTVKPTTVQCTTAQPTTVNAISLPIQSSTTTDSAGLPVQPIAVNPLTDERHVTTSFILIPTQALRYLPPAGSYHTTAIPFNPSSFATTAVLPISHSPTAYHHTVIPYNNSTVTYNSPQTTSSTSSQNPSNNVDIEKDSNRYQDLSYP